MFSQGSGRYGRLGRGSEEDCWDSWVRVQTGEVSFVDISCGAAHWIGRTKDGAVYSCGKCHVGQLGHGNEDTDEYLPRLISSLKDRIVERVGCGTSHALFVMDDHRVFGCGMGYFYTMGGSEKHRCTPLPIDGLPSVSLAVGGEFHSAFVSTEHEQVWFVGGKKRRVRNPIGLELSKVSTICQGRLDCACIRDGRVYLWNVDSDTQPPQNPLPVDGFVTDVALAGEGGRALLLLRDGVVLSWPDNVVVARDAISISHGGHETGGGALLQTGELCWILNDNKKLSTNCPEKGAKQLKIGSNMRLLI